MSIQFHETIMGKKFYEGTLPRLIKAIEENTKEMKRSNDLKEQELALLKGDADIAELPNDTWD